MDFFSNLNERQKEVVTCTDGPLLVLAGAGSGKTRSIIYRAAYLIQVKKISPWNLLIVTFTNKAASELKWRLKQAFEISASTMWVGTFHSVCAKILRYESDKINFSSDFTIYDEKDQKTLLKKIYKKLDVDTKNFPLSKIRNIISRDKNSLITPNDYYKFHKKNYFSDVIYTIYNEYQNALKDNNAMDFDDLLMNTAILLHNNEEVQQKYSYKFKYVMIDEYQDTNYAQFKIINLIAKKHQNLCVVGDDDQAIYGWRGADIRNILNFEKDYENVKIIKLEQNYRSTKVILDMANSLISHNVDRHPKKLITNKTVGKKPILSTLETEHNEAGFIADKIEELIKLNYKPKEIAIFYRTNAQSRVFEKIFATRGIKYRLVGAVNFFSRKEIKDILAYMRILINSKDDISFLRIINFPKRGIGKTTIARLSDFANSKNLSLQEAVYEQLDFIPIGAQKKLKNFAEMIKSWKNNDFDITELAEDIMEKSGMSDLYQYSKDIQDISRWENLREFIASIEEFKDNFEDDRNPTLSDYLEQVSLQTSVDVDGKENKNSISLMTIHNAKGLEFDCVFIAGVEDGLLPHIRSLEDDTIEEERRLFYVAITRARKILYVTYAKYRRYMQTIEPTIPSRFLSEIDEKLYEKINVSQYELNSPKRRLPKKHITFESDKFFKIGQIINHKTFGDGIIINVDGKGENAKLTISFNNGELKKIVGTYVELI